MGAIELEPVYTERDSKIENLTKPVPEIFVRPKAGAEAAAIGK